MISYSYLLLLCLRFPGQFLLRSLYLYSVFCFFFCKLPSTPCQFPSQSYDNHSWSAVTLKAARTRSKPHSLIAASDRMLFFFFGHDQLCGGRFSCLLFKSPCLFLLPPSLSLFMSSLTLSLFFFLLITPNPFFDTVIKSTFIPSHSLQLNVAS